SALAPELNLGGIGEVDFGQSWQREAWLNATTASWFVGSVADTIPFDFEQIPGNSKGLQVLLTDSAVASSQEGLAVGGTTYQTTKTTHSLRISFSYLLDTQLGTIPLTFTTVTLTRNIWISPDLGTIVRE